MKTISATELRFRFSEVLDDAEKGITTVITRYGKPVAQIIPAKSKRSKPHQSKPLIKRKR